MSSQIIWNTKTIQDNIEKLRTGSPISFDCFYERNPELKAPNILFQLTHEEEQEFIKCSSDVEYFVETYCKFLTDKGRTLVKLRDSQKDILNTLGEEKWIEELDDVGPVVRNFILNSARQTGKCFLFNTQIVIKNTLTNSLTKISVGELYNIVNKQIKQTKKQRIISKIKAILYKLYQKLS